MYEEYLEVLFKYSLELLLRRKKKKEAAEEQQTASEEQQRASQEQERASEEQQRAPEEQQSSANEAGDVNRKVATSLTENAVDSKTQDNADIETEVQCVAVPNPDAEDRTDTCQTVENTVSGAKIDEGSDKSLSHVEDVSESSDDNEYSLSELHFNFTTLLLWLSVTLINVPSVLVWAHNYG